MLRVAALARVILDNWNGQKIDDQSVVTCAMYHDIAKPVNFDIEKQRQYVTTEEEFNEVKRAINDMINRYGTEEHVAAIKIFQEIGSSEEAIRLINNLEWIYLPRLLNENDIPSLLVNYCDMRIGPKGILPIAMRFSDLKERAPFEGIDEIAKLTPKLESLIQSHTSIDLMTITDDQINNQIEKFE
jgi:hypothetical protein